MVLEGLENGTSWFVGVGTVRKAAILREREDFLKIAGEFFRLHIKDTKAFNSWGIDEIPLFYWYHLTEGGCVLTSIMSIGNL